MGESEDKGISCGKKFLCHSMLYTIFLAITLAIFIWALVGVGCAEEDVVGITPFVYVMVSVGITFFVLVVLCGCCSCFCFADVQCCGITRYFILFGMVIFFKMIWLTIGLLIIIANGECINDGGSFMGMFIFYWISNFIILVVTVYVGFYYRRYIKH